MTENSSIDELNCSECGTPRTTKIGITLDDLELKSSDIIHSQSAIMALPMRHRALHVQTTDWENHQCFLLRLILNRLQLVSTMLKLECWLGFPKQKL